MRTFTFGFDHKHPITGASLARHYIQVPGDADESRDIMNAVFGKGWAMQYESPAEFKYPQNMVELKWTEELFERARSNAYPTTLRLLNEHALAQAKAEEIDAYFDEAAGRPPVETHTGTPVVEYGLAMAGRGTKQVFCTDEEHERIYPLAKQIRHTRTYGGKVYRRRIVVLEEWELVTDGEVDELCKPYDEREAGLTPKNEGTILP